MCVQSVAFSAPWKCWGSSWGPLSYHPHRFDGPAACPPARGPSAAAHTALSGQHGAPRAAQPPGPVTVTWSRENVLNPGLGVLVMCFSVSTLIIFYNFFHWSLYKFVWIPFYKAVQCVWLNSPFSFCLRFAIPLKYILIWMSSEVYRVASSSFFSLQFGLVSFIAEWINSAGITESAHGNIRRVKAALSLAQSFHRSLAPSQSCERHQTAHWIEHLSFLLFPLPLFWFYQCFAALLCVFTRARFKDALQRSLLMAWWYHCETDLEFSCWFLWHVNKSVI